MLPKVNALEAFIKTAAVGGIVLLWVNFTGEALQMAWHIISTSPGDCKASFEVVCENCQEHFIDDEYGLIYGNVLCESCRLKTNLKNNLSIYNV